MLTLYKVIGTDSNKANLSLEKVPEDEGPIEETNGIVSVSLKAYGDAPGVPLITVVALSKDEAIRAYKRMHKIYTDDVFE